MSQFYSNGAVIEETRRQTMTSFMNQVYSWMTIGLVITAFCAWYVSNSLPILRFIFGNTMVFYGLIIGKLALVFVISGMIDRLSAGVATLLFLLYSLSTGLVLSVIFIVYTQTTIVSTFFITAGMFAALSIYGYATKSDLSAIGRFCFMGLIGIIIASLVNIFLKNSAMTMIISYIGVAVFAGLTAYDTQKLRELGDNIPADDSVMLHKYAILGALTLYLDFINLFLMLLRILGNRD